MRRFSLIAFAAASLVLSSPVMSASVNTESISVKPCTVEAVNIANTDSPDQNPASAQEHVIIIEHATYRSDMIHYAVLRSGPAGITALQMSSLVNLPVQSQFINYANRYRASHIT